MSAFTPGPWTTIVIDGNLFIVPGMRDGEIALLRKQEDDPISDEERSSNGYLIGAAPDLFTALNAMVAEFDKFSRHGSPIAREANEAMRHARAAIAKATGA